MARSGDSFLLILDRLPRTSDITGERAGSRARPPPGGSGLRAPRIESGHEPGSGSGRRGRFRFRFRTPAPGARSPDPGSLSVPGDHPEEEDLALSDLRDHLAAAEAEAIQAGEVGLALALVRAHHLAFLEDHPFLRVRLEKRGQRFPEARRLGRHTRVRILDPLRHDRASGSLTRMTQSHTRV